MPWALLLMTFLSNIVCALWAECIVLGNEYEDTNNDEKFVYGP